MAVTAAQLLFETAFFLIPKRKREKGDKSARYPSILWTLQSHSNSPHLLGAEGGLHLDTLLSLLLFFPKFFLVQGVRPRPGR